MAESDAASPKRRGRPPAKKNTAAEVSKSFSVDMNKLWRTNFRALEKLIWRDLNNNPKSQTFYKYTKDNIVEYLKDPQKNEKQLRNAVIYMYGASSHFRRLIQYFVGLSDLSYFILPYGIDASSAKGDLRKKFLKASDYVSKFDIKRQCKDILTVCLREDVYYCTAREIGNKITFQQLPSDYCKISSMSDNVCNVTFDFSYFDADQALIDYYSPEFSTKYAAYQKDRTQRYQDLEPPFSFAIKCNTEILNYAMPPFAGVLRNLYDISDYEDLKLTKTELENYALLVMKLGIDKDGNWLMDYQKAVEFWQNLDQVMPEEIGSVLSPMDIEKISFDRAGGTNDTDKVSDSENHLWSAAGVSSLLFNNTKASSAALLLSIKSDQAITFSIVQSIELALNRIFQNQAVGKSFRISFLDISPYNRQEMAKQYLDAARYGFPTISMYCASIGMLPCEVESLAFLESDALGLHDKLIPLQSSNTMSSSSSGRPTNQSKGEGLDDSGEQTADSDQNASRI